MSQTAQVALEGATQSFDRLFSYRVPAELHQQTRPGMRVLVPFGNGNRRRQGMILSITSEEETTPLKPIFRLLEGEPALGAEQLALVVHLQETLFCTYYDAIKLLLPAGLHLKISHSYLVNPDFTNATAFSGDEARIFEYLQQNNAPGGVREETILKDLDLVENDALIGLFVAGACVREEDVRRRVLDEKVTMARLTEEEGPPLTQKQQVVVDFLTECGTASVKEIGYYTGVGRVVLQNLRDKGTIELYEREVYRNPYAQEGQRTLSTPPALSEQQQQAFSALLAAQETKEYTISLLYGVTGSGKTQVFLQLALAVAKTGRQVLVLVPEIALTPQTIGTFHQYFGDNVAVMHSGLSLGERLDEYKRIRRGEVTVVVGTRSAVLAPLQSIGLIVIDEEQSESYKSDKAPRFHARDVARWRANYHDAQLLLASATPSIESFYHALSGRYHLVELPGRFTGSILPDVYIIDPREDGMEEKTSILSQRLCDELYQNLQMGEQSILLLNRRGYHTLVKCKDCGEAARCPNCSVALTYHSANDALCCHYCGYRRQSYLPCTLCGGKLEKNFGAGTQRVEEELGTLYPGARILRMDMDTTMQKFSHEKRFGEFAQGQYDIMVGTQMVAKGLNFPNVTLVGVLCTDQLLYSDDFRSFEHTFSLLTQVVGRAGRSAKKGRAFIQTYSPDNPVIELAASQQYRRFYDTEILTRRVGLYPPYCDIVALGLVSPSEEALSAATDGLLELITQIGAAQYKELPLRVLGPSEFALYRLSGRYRKKLLLKCRNTKALRGFLRQVQEAFLRRYQRSGVSLFVDCYYNSF